MARIELPQVIPGDLSSLYWATLRQATDAGHVQKRTPFRLPPLQTYFGYPTLPQKLVRETFLRCTRCFELQPDTDPPSPPTYGPRGRDWWYSEAGPSGQWYYNYFMQQSLISYFGDVTPNWCKKFATKAVFVNSQQPDTNFNGFPWSGVLEVYNSGGIELLTLITSPYIGMRGINLKKVTWLEDIAPPYRYIDIFAYEVSDSWGESTVTWNTRPSLGKFLGQTKVFKDITWHYILLSSPATSVALVHAGGDAGLRWRSDAGSILEAPYFSS